MLHLQALGAFEVRIDDTLIERFRSDKVRALLIYLAVEADRPHPRASLAALLWPDYADVQALRNLSQTLVRLNEALGAVAPSFLLVTRQTLQWNPQSDSLLD